MGLILTGKQQAEAYRQLCDKTVEVATPQVLSKVLEMIKKEEEESKKKIEERLSLFFQDVEKKIDRLIKERIKNEDWT